MTYSEPSPADLESVLEAAPQEFVKAAIAAAYAVMVPSASEPEARAANRLGLCPVLLIKVQSW
jgi:hypothetical protein